MKKNVFMYLAVTALLVSCSKGEDVDPASGDVQVKLSGVLNTGAGTRGDGVRESNNDRHPTVQLPLSIFRANESYGTAYTSNFTGIFDTDGSITMNPAQYYLVDGDKTSRFIAVYPNEIEYVEADRTLEFNIDGTTDIIASRVVEGSKTTKVVPMEFDHLLTQVQVSVVADGAADVDQISQQWGKVTEITISDKGGHALLTLPAADGSAQKSFAPTGTQGALTVAEYASDVLIPADGSTARYGYAMFLPTSNQLDLTITTSRGPARTVTTTNLPTLSEGHAYAITLKFKLDDVEIDGGGDDGESATLAPWVGPEGQPESINVEPN